MLFAGLVIIGLDDVLRTAPGTLVLASTVSLNLWLLLHRPAAAQVVWGEAFDEEAQARKKAERIEERKAQEKEAYERREA